MTVYARTATFQGRPEFLEAGLRFLRDDAVPTIMAMPRCVGMSVLADRGSGHVITTTAWESRDAMHASVSKIRPIREKVGRTVSGTAEVEEWEVAAMHRRPAAAPGSCARVTWLRVQRGDADLLISDFASMTLPALGAIRGFCSVSLLVNRDWGRAAICVAYDDPGAMGRRLSRSDGRHQLGENIIDVKDFDVVLPHLRVPEVAAS